MNLPLKEKFIQYLDAQFPKQHNVIQYIQKVEFYKRTDVLQLLVYIDPNKHSLFESFISKITQHQQALAPILDATQISIVFSAHKENISISHSHETAKKSHNKPSKRPIKNVKNIILVASGKGGVGKSTIAALITFMLADKGKKVGLLDADIYGPSLPQLIGIHHNPEIQDNYLIPHKKYNIEFMSIGFIIDPSKAAMWRGPMASKALFQMLSQTKWGDDHELDYLIIDTPPGTSDIHLSLIENYLLGGVVLVTTPQQLAINAVKKSIDLYNTTDVPIKAVINNMAALHINGSITYPFGKLNSKQLGINNIIDIPLEPEIGILSTKSQFIKLLNNQNICSPLQRINSILDT